MRVAKCGTMVTSQKNVPQINFAGPFRMALILSLYSLSLQLNSELPCRLFGERGSTGNILIANGPPRPQKMSQSVELLCRILFDTSLSTPDIIRSSIPDVEQQAEALEIYNHAISPICTLPPELRIHVLRYLSVADVMALRLVSRSFFSSTPRQNPTWNERIDFRDRLRFDRYIKLAEVEPRDIRRLGELGCSVCHQSHPRSVFESKETVKSPYVRQCHAWSRVFRLCAHFSIKRKEITAMIPETSSFRRYLDCKKCPDGDIRLFGRSFSSGNNSEVIYGIYRTLKSSAWNCSILRVEIQHILQQLGMPACPHMRTDDTDFLDRILTCPRGDRTRNYDNGRSIDPFFSEAYVCNGIRIACPNQQCNTTIEIDRRKSPGPIAHVDLSIRRNLGKMTDVMDLKWLIQLERSSS
jgi:hypothetical protein